MLGVEGADGGDGVQGGLDAHDGAVEGEVVGEGGFVEVISGGVAGGAEAGEDGAEEEGADVGVAEGEDEVLARVDGMGGGGEGGGRGAEVEGEVGLPGGVFGVHGEDEARGLGALGTKVAGVVVVFCDDPHKGGGIVQSGQGFG